MKQFPAEVYQKVFDNALVAIGITDKKGRFIMVNSTWCKMLGYSEKEAYKLTLDDITPSEDQERSDANYQQLINKNVPCFHKTRLYKCKNGSTFWADLNVSPIFNEQNEVDGVFGIFVDINTKIQTELQLKEANKVLKNLISELSVTNHALEILNKEMTEANQEITRKNTELNIAYKKLEELARTDELTGLPNRRVLDEVIRMEIRRTHRSKRGFTIAIGDIDGFKHFNDTYGHDCGDIVLKHIAKIMRDKVRTTDYIGRWGGEEFMFILPETDCEGSLIVLDRVRSHIGSHKVRYKELELQVTITIGYSFFGVDCDFDRILKQADLALYAGKRRGKNICICYTDDLHSEQQEISYL